MTVQHTKPVHLAANQAILPNGIRIAEINPHETDFLYDEIFVQKIYTSYGISVIPGGLVLDIGANIGMFAIYMHQEFSEIQFKCFEPAPECIGPLRQNLSYLGHSVKIFQTAIGDYDGVVEFTYYPEYSILSGIHADLGRDLTVLRAGARAKYIERYATEPSERELDLLVGSKVSRSKKMNCSIKTLSSVFEQENIQHVSLLKIDVERAELAILRGINPGDWQKIDQIVVEVHDQGAREHEIMSAMLQEFGYSTRILTELVLNP